MREVEYHCLPFRNHGLKLRRTVNDLHAECTRVCECGPINGFASQSEVAQGRRGDFG